MSKMVRSKKATIQRKNEIGEEKSDVGYVIEVSCQKRETYEFPVTTDVNEQNIDKNNSTKPLPFVENEFNLIVFVGNLNEKITVADVKELFVKQAGVLENEMLNVSMLWKVKKDVNFVTFTFIEFASEHAFQSALKLNNSFHNGQSLLVLPSVQTHCGLFHMEKEAKEKKKLEEIKKLKESKEEEESEKLEGTAKFIETEKLDETGKFYETVKLEETGQFKEMEETGQFKEMEESGQFKDTEKLEEAGKFKETKNVEETGKLSEIEKEEETAKVRETEENEKEESKVETVKHKGTEKLVQPKDIEKVKDSKTKSASNGDYVPVYKKSGHVAYLKHLPPDVTEDEVLKFFSFTRNDIVDIFVLKNTRGRKSNNNKRSEVRAVIAFPSEENLEKCLAQSCKTFRNLCVVVERHGMTKNTLGGEKRSFSPSALNDCSETTSSPKRQVLSDASEKNTDSTDNIELDLFVKHINWNASDRIIRDFFASVGARAQGMKQFGEPGTKVRGMGFVTMADKESLIKGLALDGAVLLGNKIKVSIRNDRKFLVRPLEGELPPNYSTFIAKLPIKKSAETLKSALSKFLKDADCSVKTMFIPLADNHSGNRGYAFVTFEDERSLTKALEFNGSEIQICDCKVKITVSNHWPENVKETTDAILKNKDQEYKRGNFNVEQESSKSGKQHRRKRKGFSSPHRGSLYRSQRETSKKFAMQGSGAIDYPLNQQQRIANYNSYDSDYVAYLDYLEFRDYVAMRKAYSEQQVHTDYPTHPEPGNREEFRHKPKASQSYLPPVTQNSFGTNVTRTYQEPISESKEENRESGWRNYSSYVSSGGVDGVGYGHLQSSSAPSTSSYDKFGQNPALVSTSGYEKLPQTSLPSANCGYEKVLSSTSSTSISREKQDFHHTAPRSSSMDTKGSSNAVWTPGDRYNTTDKISLSSEWYGSNSQSCWERRDSEVLPQSTLSSIDSSNRGMKLSNCSANYVAERGSSAYTTQHSSPAHVPAHSPSVRTNKSEHDLGLYSRMDRRSSAFKLVAAQNSLSTNPATTEETTWHSYSTSSTTRTQANEAYPYVEYPSSVTKRGDEQRNNAVYEKSGSFVNKLLTSGILSNAGYNVSVGGYRAN